MMADHAQRIHPVDIEAQKQSAPLVPGGAKSDHGDPALVGGYYPPPPRRTIPASYLPPPRRRRSFCCRCCCWTTIILVLLIVLFAVALAVLYFVLDPKLPKYSVDHLAITSFNLDSSSFQASATFDVRVTAENPNKKIGIYYEDGSNLAVYYDAYRLCSGVLPAFYQGYQNTTTLEVAMNGSVQLGSSVLPALQQAQQAGAVPLQFQGNVPVSLKVFDLKSSKITATVSCDLVVDSLQASSNIKVKTSNCKFSLKS